MSELQRGHHGCPETGLETSAGTPAPSPLASEALTAVQREHRATLLTRPTPNVHVLLHVLNGAAVVAAGKPGPRNVPLQAPRMRGGGRAVQDVGDSLQHQSPPHEVAASLLPPKTPDPYPRELDALSEF